MDKNNNDLFELMTKMYGDLTGTMQKMHNEMQEMKGEISNIKNEVTKTNITMENEIKPRIEALFDGYKQNSEYVNELSDKVDEVQSDINRLTIKTLRTESNIIDINKILKNN